MNYRICKVCGDKHHHKVRCEVSIARMHINELLKRRSHYYRRDYGLSVEEVLDLMEFQGFRCAVCERPFDRRLDDWKSGDFYMDHCHITNAARGFLCTRCNAAEGMMKASRLPVADFIGNMLEYWKQSPLSKMRLSAEGICPTQ